MRCDRARRWTVSNARFPTLELRIWLRHNVPPTADYSLSELSCIWYVDFHHRQRH
jgi:hypothetical protein